jgi:hypothetical protein
MYMRHRSIAGEGWTLSFLVQVSRRRVAWGCIAPHRRVSHERESEGEGRDGWAMDTTEEEERTMSEAVGARSSYIHTSSSGGYYIVTAHGSSRPLGAAHAHERSTDVQLSACVEGAHVPTRSLF